MSALSLLYLGTLLCWQIVSICPYDTDEWERSQARERARVLSTTEATWRREPGWPSSVCVLRRSSLCRFTTPHNEVYLGLVSFTRRVFEQTNFVSLVPGHIFT